MIHVVTVHYLDDRWIGPQLRFLHRHLPAERTITGCLNGIDPRWAQCFDHTVDLPGEHADKLNALARIVTERGAAPDDLLLFVDGDAFPIAPVRPEILGTTPLAAVRRDENLADRQPHPCFCLTTVGFWNDLGGDWGKGHTWETSTGSRVTDVGGNLLGLLEARGIEWTPLVRTNVVDLDPLYFGIYADLVYHHGAGFRIPKTRRMLATNRQDVLFAASGARTPAWVPVVGRVERSVRYRYADFRQRQQVSQLVLEARDQADDIYRAIETDDEFFRRFLTQPDPAATVAESRSESS
ncbi:MAG: hypothetical protein ACXVLZ_02635 [Acidimicrobiia bacterium]